MNVTFAKSLDAFVKTAAAEVNAFGTLVTYAQEVITAAVDAKMVPLTALKNTLSVDEAAYKANKPKVEVPSTYRSAKSVILNAVEQGVALVDANGKPLGKTALEKATKEAKDATASVKTEAQKFASTISTASSIFAKVETVEDITQCKAVLLVLADMVVKAHAAALAKAAEEKAAKAAE